MNHGVWLLGADDIDTATLVALGVEAEAAGWDGVFVSDQLSGEVYPDPWSVLGGIAAGTEDVTIGTWVVPIPRREPWEVANAVAALDRLSDGRMLLGTGLGNAVDYEPYGRSYEPSALAGRLDESLELITAFWTGDPVTHDGEHFSVEAATVRPTPVQEPRVPILSGAWWPNKRPFHRGATWDGIMPYYASLTDDRTGPHGEEASGDPLTEIRESLEYYREIADDPGQVVLPGLPDTDVPTEEFAELGVTWQLTNASDPETVRSGPPA